MRATVAATASTKRPSEFDVMINVPSGARPGDIVTLVAGRQAANLTVFQPATSQDVLYLPDGAGPINSLADTGVDGSYLLALGACGSDGCSAAGAVNLQKQTIAPIHAASPAAARLIIANARANTISAVAAACRREE